MAAKGQFMVNGSLESHRPAQNFSRFFILFTGHSSVWGRKLVAIVDRPDADNETGYKRKVIGIVLLLLGLLGGGAYFAFYSLGYHDVVALHFSTERISNPRLDGFLDNALFFSSTLAVVGAILLASSAPAFTPELRSDVRRAVWAPAIIFAALIFLSRACPLLLP